MRKQDRAEAAEDHVNFMRTMKKACALRKSKAADYGLSYRNFGPVGIAARIDDKLQRVKNMLLNKRLNHESAYDSAVDMANYSIMLAMELERENALRKRI